MEKVKRFEVVQNPSKLGPAYNEFGYMSRFLCVKIFECNVKKFGYNDHPLIRSNFFCIFLLVVNGTQCGFIGLIHTKRI